MLHDAVETQRRELRARLAERYVPRRLARPLRDDPLITVIMGPRRCGKSFLAMRLLGQVESRGYLKIYCIDNGLVSARGVRFTPDTGRMVENLVAVALRKRALDGACELFFWKDARQREVDFVVKEGRQVTQLIQVCWDLTGERTRQREFRALLQAGRDLACDRLLVLTADTDSEEEVEWYGNRGRIRLLPVWRWLHDPN